MKVNMFVLYVSVEFILGMNGATMGTLICYIFPALFFVRVMANKPEGKHIARVGTGFAPGRDFKG